MEVDADVEDPTAAILSALARYDLEGAVVKLIYHIGQDRIALVRDSDIKEALSAAFMVVAIVRDVTRDDSAVRNKLLNESLDPTRALEMYFDTKESYRKRKPELMEYAKPLIEEMLAEERVSG
jgi:exonuclease SbcD